MNLDINFLIALIMAVTCHEFAHAWVANYLGDPTARYLGRLTLNPLAHLDPVGTIMLLVAGFGWGKPVPFQTTYLKNPRLDSALIAFSGPLTNFILALSFALPFRLIFLEGDPSQTASLLWLYEFLKMSIQLNLLLMIFNLLPLPPLDGSKIFSLLIPGHLLRTFDQYRDYGYLLLILFVFSGTLFGKDILGAYILFPFMDFFWRTLLY